MDHPPGTEKVNPGPGAPAVVERAGGRSPVPVIKFLVTWILIAAAGVALGLYLRNYLNPPAEKLVVPSPARFKVATITISGTKDAQFLGSYSDFRSSSNIVGTVPATFTIENPEDLVTVSLVNTTQGATLTLEVALDGEVRYKETLSEYRGTLLVKIPLVARRDN